MTQEANGGLESGSEIKEAGRQSRKARTVVGEHLLVTEDQPGKLPGVQWSGFPTQPQRLSSSSSSFRCWFQKEPALYATVHGYFLVSFLFGAVVLALVAWKIFTLPSVTAGKEQGQTWKSVFTVLGLSSLVGMTWGLAVLTPLGLSTIYIFALFNSLQGEAVSLAPGIPGGQGRHFPGHRIPQKPAQDKGANFRYARLLWDSGQQGRLVSQGQDQEKPHKSKQIVPPSVLELNVASYLGSVATRSLSAFQNGCLT